MERQATDRGPRLTAVQADRLSVASESGLALEEATFEVPAGAFLVIVGPNGSGKSTLIKTLLGLVRPASGSVLVFGRKPGSKEGPIVGYVPQVKATDRGFPSIAIELVVSGIHSSWPTRIRPLDRERAIETLDAVGACDLAEKSLNRLSGGELQRVYLARALVRKPKLLLLDEPATGIDANGEEAVTQALDAVHATGETTILMVTHDLDLARHHADLCLVLNRKVLAFGPAKGSEIEQGIHQAYGHAGHQHWRND